MNFGWQKKVERLRRVILSGGHQVARELPPGISRILASLARVSETGDGMGLHEEISSLPQDEHKLLWEPLDVYGWRIHATLYLRDGTLWWLVHAVRKNEAVPRDKDVVLLDKVLDHLGAVPSLHVIIGPRSGPPGEPALPFGWWTWQNRWPLYDVQVNKCGPHDHDKIRVVPLGSRETDGYQSLFKDPKPDEEN